MTDINKIVTSVPVDRTAATVTSRGEAPPNYWTNPLDVCSDTPLPTRRVPINVPDMSGLSYGRFVVIGLARVKGRWVVRCRCGTYTHRSAKALKNEGGTRCCNKCQTLIQRKRHQHWISFGEDTHERDYL